MLIYEKEKYGPWRVLSHLPIEQVDATVRECLAASTHLSHHLLGRVDAGRGCLIQVFKNNADLRHTYEALFNCAPDETMRGLWSPEHGILVENLRWLLTHELIHEVLQLDFPDSPWVLNEGIPRHFEALCRDANGSWVVPWTENLIDSYRTIRNAFNDGLMIYDILDMAEWKHEDWIEKKYFEPTYPGRPLVEAKVLYGFFAYVIRFMDAMGILKSYYASVKKAYYALPKEDDWMILDEVYPILKQVGKCHGIDDVEGCFRSWADQDWAKFIERGIPAATGG